MTDLRRGLSRVDEVPAPDLWLEATRRTPGPLPRAPVLGRVLTVALTLAVVAAGVGIGVAALHAHPRAGSAPATSEPSAAPTITPCSELLAGCQAIRLPNITLTAGETDGALQPVTGMDLTGIISFDEALRRAGQEDGHAEAKTVQVVLGSAEYAETV